MRLLNTLLLCCCTTLLLCGCSNRRKDVAAIAGILETRQDKAEDVTIIYSKEGNVQARLYARHFVRAADVTPAYIDMKGGLKVEFFDDSLHLKNTVTARNGRWYEQQGNVVIRDSVVVVNNKGERLDTDELVWNENLRKFYTEKPVRITTPTQIIFGKGMEANEDFSWYQINRITGSVLVDKAGLPE